MIDNNKIINRPQLRYTYPRERICINIHYIDAHSYIIQISGLIGLFSNKWAKGTKYCGWYRTSVGSVLITELGYRSEFLKRIVNCWQLKRMWIVWLIIFCHACTCDICTVLCFKTYGSKSVNLTDKVSAAFKIRRISQIKVCLHSIF